MTYGIILDILIILTAAIISGEIFEQLNLPGIAIAVIALNKGLITQSLTQ
jgi:hypothetical protein